MEGRARRLHPRSAASLSRLAPSRGLGDTLPGSRTRFSWSLPPRTRALAVQPARCPCPRGWTEDAGLCGMVPVRHGRARTAMPPRPACPPPSLLTYPGASLPDAKPAPLCLLIPPGTPWPMLLGHPRPGPGSSRSRRAGVGRSGGGPPPGSQQVPAQTRSLQPWHLSVNPQHRHGADEASALAGLSRGLSCCLQMGLH